MHRELLNLNLKENLSDYEINDGGFGKSKNFSQSKICRNSDVACSFVLTQKDLSMKFHGTSGS
ncbi:MAG: hypothetical protein IJ575_00555 [Selenomonadaceae bacterium]|nr:hypothetical protein [Selenomonadaceae bacterium]